MTVHPSPAALRALRVDAPPGFVDAVMDQVGLHQPDRFVTVTGPAGDLFVAFNNSGISVVMPSALFDDDAKKFALHHRRVTGRPAIPAARPRPGWPPRVRSGRGTGLRYDLSRLTSFERAVLGKTLEIPSGEVRPYGWVAREIGRPRAVRAVGSALGRNPVPVLIPCHRVVRSDGHIGNYGLGVPMKKTLLHAEGVDIDRLEQLAEGGVRFLGSDTTGVFCVPSCVHATRIRSVHEVHFRTSASAVAAGYRPCPHCTPVAERDASQRVSSPPGPGATRGRASAPWRWGGSGRGPAPTPRRPGRGPVPAGRRRGARSRRWTSPRPGAGPGAGG